MIITSGQLKAILPYNKNSDAWLDPLNDILPNYNIDTVNRVAAFLAECAHESTEFTVLEENLHYTAAELLECFPAYFANTMIAGAYAGQPERIANRIYANRLGNGPETSGDGWNYRGRGLIQLTGKFNYQAFGNTIGYLLEDVTDFLQTNAGAVQSACYFWNSRPMLNTLADTGDIDRISRLVNGGINGLEDRHQRYIRAVKILGNHG